jgi:hypothetical protein
MIQKDVQKSFFLSLNPKITPQKHPYENRTQNIYIHPRITPKIDTHLKIIPKIDTHQTKSSLNASLSPISSSSTPTLGKVNKNSAISGSMVVTVSKGERGERGVGLENKSGEGGCVRSEGEFDI